MHVVEPLAICLACHHIKAVRSRLHVWEPLSELRHEVGAGRDRSTPVAHKGCIGLNHALCIQLDQVPMSIPAQHTVSPYLWLGFGYVLTTIRQRMDGEAGFGGGPSVICPLSRRGDRNRGALSDSAASLLPPTLRDKGAGKGSTAPADTRKARF